MPASPKTDKPVRFTFDGDTYTVPPSDAWPYKVLPLLGQGQIDEVLLLLLGDKQHATFTSRDGLTVGDVNRFFEVLQAAAKAGN